MDRLLWDFVVGRGLPFGEAFLMVLLVNFAMFWDYPLLLLWFLAVRVAPARGSRGGEPSALPALVVIPSLLRKRDELTSMLSTIESIATNGYPGPLTIVISIDGTSDAPPLYRELQAFQGTRRWNARTRLYVTGTPGRRGKPMAIDHAVEFVKELVAGHALSEFPPVYISTDADADLGSGALWAIVSRLQRRNVLTGAPPAAVAGALHVRGNDFWRGWRHFFTVEGQLTLQVAREYYVSNVGRYNVRALPATGIPGAFYCTWSEIFTSIPRFMGYLQTLRPRHWLGWWIGIPPPSFSRSTAAPLPERIAGDTDDTVTAYVATLARYRNGHFELDPPRTPLHAAYYMLRTLFVDRPLQYEPRARVFTSSPNTFKSLFRQRRRWNSARVELSLRLWKAFGYHWGLSLPAMVVQGLVARSFVRGMVAYVFIPFVMFRGHCLFGMIVGYGCNVSVSAVLTISALLMTNELQYWRLTLALPLAPLYAIVFNWFPAAVGITSDVFLFGNVTGFSPEWTLKRGGSVRIALLFRLRRAFLLALRSATRGDVPLGTFWLGWRETPWTPNGFEGWTTGKRPSPILGQRLARAAVHHPQTSGR